MSECEISNADMPDEIVMDILSRLPVMSLLQFRGVSKQWRDIIADAKFIKAHLQKSLTSSSHQRLLIPTSPLRSLDYSASQDSTSASVELDCQFVGPKTLIKILGSCNGLVCLIDSIGDMIIYNPSTRHSKALPSPQQVLNYPHWVEFVYGFGCGLNPDDLKVVRFPRFARDSEIVNFEVLGANTSYWRSRVLTHSYDFIDTAGTFVNESLHWLARHSIDDDEDRVVASFSVSKEVFTNLSLPPQETALPSYTLGVLQGCLSVLSNNIYDTYVDVWLMRDYGVSSSWIQFVKIPLYTGIKKFAYMMPLSSLNDNEILLEIDLRLFVVYNIKNNTFRDVTTVHDLNWFGDAAVYVESLVSPDGVQ